MFSLPKMKWHKSDEVMTINQVTTVDTSAESETLEFKETTGTSREAARTVCAFLN